VCALESIEILPYQCRVLVEGKIPPTSLVRSFRASDEKRAKRRDVALFADLSHCPAARHPIPEMFSREALAIDGVGG
jgi:hypothetical protein